MPSMQLIQRLGVRTSLQTVVSHGSHGTLTFYRCLLNAAAFDVRVCADITLLFSCCCCFFRFEIMTRRWNYVKPHESRECKQASEQACEHKSSVTLNSIYNNVISSIVNYIDVMAFIVILKLIAVCRRFFSSLQILRTHKAYMRQ